MSDSTKKKGEGAGWYKLRLVKRPSGPRRRLVRIGPGYVKFNASQQDAKADDYPEKLIRLTADEARQFKASRDYEIRPTAPPKVDSLGKRLTSRTIGAVEVPTVDPVKEEEL